MKWTVAIVAMVVGVTGLCRADVARGDTNGRCFEGVSPEQKVESCTAMIQSAGQTSQVLVAAYMNRGLAYRSKGEYDRAIADFGEVIRLDPKYALAYMIRGSAYNDKGSYDRAIADLDESILVNPRYGPAYLSRGLAYDNKRDHDRAIADFDEANRWQGFDPKEALAYNNRGLVYASKRDYARAIADYNRALTLDPTLAAARQNRQSAQAAIATQAVQADDTRPDFDDTLRNLGAINDSTAKAVADALRQTGFQSVELAIDLDRDAMVKALRAFRNQADRADWALIYFAGHGIEINRVNYLIPTDAKLHDDRDVQSEAVSYEELLNTIGRAKALRLVILDACRINPFKERMNRTMASRGTDRGLAPPPESAPGTLIVYSAKDGEVAEDGDDGTNSPFALAFVAELKVPGRELRRLFDYVRDDVLEATHNRQQPFTYGSLPGRRDFYFVAKR
jgi:uncharacterized caspase-like protein